MSKPFVHPVTELAELRQRVEAAGESLGEAAAENQKLHERLLGLLSVVEECFAHSQHKIESLSEELARTNEEKQQLQAMLQTLLAETEGDSVRAIGATRRELEARINSLVEAASSISETLGEGATKSTMGSAVTVNTIEDDGTAVGSETGTEPAVRRSEEILKKALAVSEKVEPLGTEGGEENEPLELTQMVAEGEAVVDLNTDKSQSPVADRTTVQQIIKRVSLMTGTLREEQANTSPESEAAPEEDKKVKHDALLDIPDFLDRRSDNTLTPVRHRASVRRRA